MDYKQFEGHTPEPWITKLEGHYFRNPGVFGRDGKQLTASVYGGNQSELLANSNLLAAAPDLLKENQSLKLELQKQKELCKATIALLDNIMSDMKEEGGNVWYTDQIEELIKKSNEIEI